VLFLCRNVNFFLLFILVRGPGRAHHVSMTAETSAVLPNNTLVKEITWVYTDLHRAAWEPSSMKSQSASNRGLFIETLGIYLVSPRHASKEGCKLARSESVRNSPHLPNSRGASPSELFALAPTTPCRRQVSNSPRQLQNDYNANVHTTLPLTRR
jgi:hypothetical protein